MTEVRLPAEWLEWQAAARLTTAECGVLAYLLRQTYGWSRETTEGWGGASAIQGRTGLDGSSIRRALRSLQAKGVLVETQGATPVSSAVYSLVAPTGWGVAAAPPPGSAATPWQPRKEVADAQGGEVAAVQGGEVAAAPPRNSENNSEREQDQQQQPRARGWSLAEHGPQPPRVEAPAYDGDVSAAVDRVCRAMTRPDQQGVVRRPTAMQEQHVAMAMLEVGVERVEAIARLCAAEGWGVAGLLRCFDADGRELPDKLPGAKREAAPSGKTGGGPVPAWLQVKRLKERGDLLSRERGMLMAVGKEAEALEAERLMLEVDAQVEELERRIGRGEVA